MPDHLDIPYAAHAQEADLLCWAAATQVVVEVLGNPLDQCTIAAYAYFLPTQVPDFPNKLKSCNDNIKLNCDCMHAPVLARLGYTCAKKSELSAAEITDDIDHGRPIIFGWRYNNNRLQGQHFMVITGYSGNDNPKNLKLNIFDPLPPKTGSVQTISLRNYTVAAAVETKNDMGLPYELGDNYYNIQLPSAPAPVPVMAPVPVLAPGPMPVPALAGTQPMDPRQAIEASWGAAQDEVAQRESEEGIRLSAGFPLPIIALGLQELRSTEPQSLLAALRRNTGTLLYPIETEGRVRDSFLMIKRGDGWLEGGYANTTAARRLVGLRRQQASTQPEFAEHYLLSVPALGAFFLARGTAADARLIPVANHGSIKVGEKPVRANQAYRADELMPALATAARNARLGPASECDPL